MDILTISTFLMFTAGVAIATTLFVKRMKRSSNATEEYFTGGRSLSWPIVAGSLMLTNLSTEQLVGLNGAIFKDKAFVGMAWEALAAFAMIATALIFLPRYLASGFTTTPAFLEKRFDKTTRSMVSGLFLAGYITVLLPTILVTGSKAIIGMFDLDLPIWSMVIALGVTGSAYAVFGGLKSVAVSDTINGIGLLIGGLAVPALGLMALGDGSILAGISHLCNENPDYLSVLTVENAEQKSVSVPWPTLLTGMMFIQVFYWSTNQVIVQRAMAAKSLAEGQKGVLFASGLKLIGPIMLCLPGVIALHMMDVWTLDGKTISAAIAAGENVNDSIYGVAVRSVLPQWSYGLFLAVLFGSILSSFNSALNSAATLFSLQFYKNYFNRNANAEQQVSAGKVFGIAIAIMSMLIAPVLANQTSIFEYLQKVNGLYSVPIIAIFILGIYTKKVPPMGAKIGMVVGITLYSFFAFKNIPNVPEFLAGEDGSLHWLHGYFISFLVACLVMLTIGYFKPQAPKEEEKIEAPVDMTPWRHAKSVSWAIVGITVLMYLGLNAIANPGAAAETTPTMEKNVTSPSQPKLNERPKIDAGVQTEAANPVVKTDVGVQVGTSKSTASSDAALPAKATDAAATLKKENDAGVPKQ